MRPVFAVISGVSISFSSTHSNRSGGFSRNASKDWGVNTLTTLPYLGVIDTYDNRA